MDGLGNLNHPIAVSTSQAQHFFDQGLTLIYAFNHQDAERSFRRAAELDPNAPMPWWGVAMAVGPNYNLDVDPEREKIAYDAIQKALALSKHAPPSEQAYIEALAQRYSNAPKPDYHQLAVAYSQAMRKVADRFLDDPDAGTLYAESLMDLRPWLLWTNDGKPAPDTEEILARLETVLRAYPNHVGANHYYIHAQEASPHPERALPSADRLGSMVPAAGHLVHMPSHIYARTGDFNDAAAANVAAVKADGAYVERTGSQDSMYSLMYYSHNLHFLSAACAMEGNSACAIANAGQLVQHVAPGLKQMPMVETFLPYQPFMLVRFGHWDAVLQAPLPDSALLIDSAAWHYARGMAYAHASDVARLTAERAGLVATIDKIPAETFFGLNPAKSVLAVAVEILDAKIAVLKGDANGAEAHYRKAVALQDQLNYDEPADWYYPVRESLGAALLSEGDAAGAEMVFRRDLELNPRNGRSLYGLWKALDLQQRTTEAGWAKTQFEQAWAHADVQLNLADY